MAVLELYTKVRGKTKLILLKHRYDHVSIQFGVWKFTETYGSFVSALKVCLNA